MIDYKKLITDLLIACLPEIITILSNLQNGKYNIPNNNKM